MNDTVLYIVIPCYNEESVLPVTAPLFKEQLLGMVNEGLISDKSRILFVNDGSCDKTWNIIEDLACSDEYFEGICLSRNRGHQNALIAGLEEAAPLCDISISIDCDGQDDIKAMSQMVKAYHDGSEIVYGVRNSRQTDTGFKRFTARTYYKLLSFMGADVVYDHADYRLVSSKVLKEFGNFKEVNVFLRGMFPLVGFRSSCVYYDRNERMAGKSHYPLTKMLALAFEGITSLSIKPIRFITGFGILIAILSFFMIIYTFIGYFAGNTVPGWASMSSIILFMSGVQLICLGIIGEYIGKIYLETKHRPRYIISERTFEKKED